MKRVRVPAKWIAIFTLIFKSSLCFGLSITSYVADPDGITCTCNTGVMKVKICQADIVRVAYSPTSTIPTRPLKIVTNTWATPGTFTKTETGDTILLQTGKIKVKVSKSTANVTYTDLSNAIILAEYAKTTTPVTVEGISTNTCRGEFNSPADEGLYGLGQHQGGTTGVTIVNYKGQTEILDQDYDRRATGVPVLVSSKGYGIFWDNYSKINFSGDISGNSRYAFSSECGDVLDYYFFYGPELDGVISGYRSATGKTPLFPKWAYGLIQSRDRYLTQTEFLAVKNGYRNNNIPVDCIVQDWQYWTGAGAQGCYCFNAGYGDVKSTVDQCHSAHIHTMVSIWAQLEEGSANYTTFDSKGWLWPADRGTTTTLTRYIDAYNSDARETFWNNIRDVFFSPAKQGWDAWWLDSDEPGAWPNNFDRHALTTALGKGCLFYNTYTFLMTEMGYKNWRRDIPDKRFVILHRANFAGQQAHSAIQWSSDINCDWPTLKNSVPAGLNSTLTGIPYWCTDIGGYWGSGVDFSTPENRELMTRWFQYGAFCPVFRIHGNTPSNQGKELYASNWDDITKANLLLIDKLHYRLMPYVYSLAWMTTNNDYTPMRHLIFDFRNDPAVKTIGDQFMYGPAFMVSPVTTQGQTSRSVYLPAGKWYDFWTGATVNGGTTLAAANAPLSQIPLHLRAGSIVPLGPEIQYATERADTIELRVYPGANGSFTMYEDEGDNYTYETGKYATIPITYVDNPKNVIIGARSGSFTGMDAKKVFNIVYVSSNHGAGEGQTAAPDTQLVYTGAQVSIIPVSILPSRQTGFSAMPSQVTMRTATKTVQFPSVYSGKTKEIELYDCNGRLVRAFVTAGQRIDLSKNLSAAQGMYIVKVRLEAPK